MTFDYKKYWENTYASGGNSGAGSYGALAEFKAEIINAFIAEHAVETVIEFGCGDGNQLGLMGYKNYLGLDVSPAAVRMCHEKFEHDKSKVFTIYKPQSAIATWLRKADLVVCLDVLYHVTDEDDFRATLADVFTCSRKYVVLYTKITSSEESSGIDTIKDRDIFEYLKLVDFSYRVVEQRHKELSSASFIILERRETP